MIPPLQAINLKMFYWTIKLRKNLKSSCAIHDQFDVDFVSVFVYEFEIPHSVYKFCEPLRITIRVFQETCLSAIYVKKWSNINKPY